MSVSSSTHEFYRAKFQSLRRRTAEKFGIQNVKDVSAGQIVDFLFGLKTQLSKRSWRLYKAATVYCLEQDIWRGSIGSVGDAVCSEVRRLKREPQTGAIQRSCRTSARKAKNLGNEDMASLQVYLNKHQPEHRWAKLMSIFLTATALTGLRPSEWYGSELLLAESPPKLRVLNAKSTNGRGNGRTRTLHLIGLTPKELDAIDELIDVYHGYDADGFGEEMRNGFNAYFYRTVRRVLGKRGKYPAPSTLRHYFSANAKATHPEEAVSALMGHASDASAVRNYARRSSAKGKVKVHAEPSEVAKVRRVRRPRNLVNQPLNEP